MWFGITSKMDMREETMRAIDADKLKEVLEKNFGHTGGASVLAQLIDAQDTIQPEPHWIPISERLPKIYEDVLLSYFDEVTIGWLNGDGSWSIYDGWKCVSADEISAWMPLPKVFKENERESN